MEISDRGINTSIFSEIHLYFPTRLGQAALSVAYFSSVLEALTATGVLYSAGVVSPGIPTSIFFSQADPVYRTL